MIGEVSSIILFLNYNNITFFYEYLVMHYNGSCRYGEVLQPEVLMSDNQTSTKNAFRGAQEALTNAIEAATGERPEVYVSC